MLPDFNDKFPGLHDLFPGLPDLFPGLSDLPGVDFGQSDESLKLNKDYCKTHMLQNPEDRTNAYYYKDVVPFDILGQVLPGEKKGGTSKKRVCILQTPRQCPHGQRDDQCAHRRLRNICSRHGIGKTRKTRCKMCWREGQLPKELCRNHGNRIGFCKPCIEAGVMKPAKRAPRVKRDVQNSYTDSTETD
jgi:hypothetical protein